MSLVLLCPSGPAQICRSRILSAAPLVFFLLLLFLSFLSSSVERESEPAREMGKGGGEAWGDIECEKRPGGMLVQKRGEESRVSVSPPLLVLVRVAYDGRRIHVSINSQATFGELKKLLTTDTGLQPGDQKLFYKGKERQNGDYLDLYGVKNRSKITLEEDPVSLERRYAEVQRNTRLQFIQKAISDISIDVDKLADQVTSIEDSISNGIKVADLQITTLVELLMRQAIKLDGIPAEGESSSKKIIQAKRVQKYVETLDMLQTSNARAENVIVATKWETFETPASATWEFFD